MRRSLLLLALLALPALAQQPPKLEPIAEPPPQPAGAAVALSDEALAEKGITVRPGETAESYTSPNGQQVIRVRQPNGRVYYLIEQQPGYAGPAGTDPSDSRLRAAQWLLHEW